MRISGEKERNTTGIDLQRFIDRAEKMGYSMSREEIEKRSKEIEKKWQEQPKSTVKKEPFIIK